MQTRQKNDLPELYERLLGAIPTGRENALTLDTILLRAGMRDKRSAHNIIHDLIVNHGKTIGACRAGQKKGYYIVEDAEDLRLAVGALKNQFINMQKRYDALYRNYRGLKHGS